MKLAFNEVVLSLTALKIASSSSRVYFRLVGINLVNKKGYCLVELEGIEPSLSAIKTK